jgi:hypothetical protein
MRRIDHPDAQIDGSADEVDILVCVAEPIRAQPYPVDIDVAESDVPGSGSSGARGVGWTTLGVHASHDVFHSCLDRAV